MAETRGTHDGGGVRYRRSRLRLGAALARLRRLEGRELPARAAPIGASAGTIAAAGADASGGDGCRSAPKGALVSLIAATATLGCRAVLAAFHSSGGTPLGGGGCGGMACEGRKDGRGSGQSGSTRCGVGAAVGHLQVMAGLGSD
mmetsp:Transcript_46784/g.120332  ORF Transcript_46784/g.120332 Transcript_46784/m.120332 type:complete len:145 (+) Transcript_46784:827-1261(+)